MRSALLGTYLFRQVPLPGTRFLAILLVATGLLAGCDDPPRSRRPPADSAPADSAPDSTDALRERRRSGSATTDDSVRQADDRYLEPSSREERRRPDIGRGATSAADAAEDQRDADADRPSSSRGE